MKKLLVLSIVAAILGCGTESTFQKLTAQYTECNSDNVQVSDVNSSGADSWKAICKSDARIYTCNREGCSEQK
jgi:hypothetical protein